MAKSLKRIKARKLRKKGVSIKDIARKLQVSTSSVSLWCRDVILTSDQIREFERRARDPNYGRRLQYALSQQKKREEKTRRLLNEGIKEIGLLSKRELFLVGVALYWAEGFKKDSRVGFASLDPEMIKLFITWLTRCCGFSTSDLTLSVTANISHEHRIGAIQKYWSEVTGVPLQSFNKPFFQKVKWKKKYDKPEEYYGVLRIRVKKSKDFLRKIDGWIEGIKKMNLG